MVSTEVDSAGTTANAFDENTSARESSKSISTLFEVGAADVEAAVGGAETPSADAYAGGPAGKEMKHNVHTQNEQRGLLDTNIRAKLTMKIYRYGAEEFEKKNTKENSKDVTN